MIFFRLKPNRVRDIHNTEGTKLFTRTCPGLNHLDDHKFRHYFQDCLEPVCSYRLKEPTTFSFTAAVSIVKDKIF